MVDTKKKYNGGGKEKKGTGSNTDTRIPGVGKSKTGNQRQRQSKSKRQGKRKSQTRNPQPLPTLQSMPWSSSNPNAYTLPFTGNSGQAAAASGYSASASESESESEHYFNSRYGSQQSLSAISENGEELPDAQVNHPVPTVNPPPPPDSGAAEASTVPQSSNGRLLSPGSFGTGIPYRARANNTGFSKHQTQQLQRDTELQDIQFKELVYHKIIHYKKCLKAIQDDQGKQQQDIDRVTKILAALSKTPGETIKNYNEIMKQGAELLDVGARAAEEGKSTEIINSQILKLVDQAIDLREISEQNDNIYRLPIYTICRSVLSQLIVVYTSGRVSTESQGIKDDVSKLIIGKLIVEIKNKLKKETKIDRNGFKNLLLTSANVVLEPYSKGVRLGEDTVATISENMNNIISHLIDTLISVNITLETIQMKYVDGTDNIEEIKRKIKHLCIPYIDIFTKSREQIIQKYLTITQNPTAFMVDTIMSLKNIEIENYIKLFSEIPKDTATSFRNLFGTINTTIDDIFQSILHSDGYHNILSKFGLQEEKDVQHFTCPPGEDEIREKLRKWESVRGMPQADALRFAELSNVDGLYGGSRKTKTPKRKQRKSKKTKTPKRKQRKSRKQRKRTRKSC